MKLSRGKLKKENSLNEMASRFPNIKKRENNRENEVLYVMETYDKHIPNQFGDRFIPRRFALNRTRNVLSTSQLDNREEQSDVLYTRLENNYWRKFNYKIEMCNVFDLKLNKINEFSDSHIELKSLKMNNINPPVKIMKNINNNEQELDWDCKPRTKPSAFIDSTHDLPGFKLHSSKQIIDWSKNGQIGASFGNDLVIWTCKTDKTVVYHTESVTALRFSPDGSSLALGLEMRQRPFIQLWSMNNTNLQRNTICLIDTFVLSKQNIKITCIEWHPKGNYLLCGMSNGEINCMDLITSESTIVQYHLSKVNSMKFNSNAKYIASCDDNSLIIILQWPSLEIHSKTCYKNGTANNIIIDWHPWNPLDMAIALSNNIAIINIQKMKEVAYYYRNDTNYVINAMAFNKISAELVMSYSIKNMDGCISYEILVMASLDRIVDVLKSHEDKVKFLLFSPDGQQLATAGDDDMLTIFNFFTPSKCLKKKNSFDKPSIASDHQSFLKIRIR